MRVDRLLSILIMISQKGMVTGNELSQSFEVSLRTIYRDIDKLALAGVPIAAMPGKNGGYYLMEGYNFDNLFLNKREIEPLTAVMDNLRQLFGKNEEINSIADKFSALKNYSGESTDKLVVNMSHFSMEQELREYLFLINKAIGDNRLLEFTYINRRMESSDRTVEPLQIEFSEGQWFVAGFCRERCDYRKFKLVRMQHLKLGELFIKRDISSKEIQRVFQESLQKSSIKVSLRFTGRIGNQLGEYFSKSAIRACDDGTYIVEDFFPDDEGLKRFILGFGTECQVEAPEELRESMKAYTRSLYEKYTSQ